MIIEKNCLNCFHCKIINKGRELTCKKDGWQAIDGRKKFIKLTLNERRKFEIGPRNIFHSAEKCFEFNDMNIE